MNITEVEIRNFKDTLSNGLTVITVEMPHIHTLEVATFLRAGLRFENEDNNGISHFLEHMMFRGNAKYPDSISLNREFEKIGREPRASTLGEYTFYGFSPHISRLERGMELFADFFAAPNFAGIDLERQVILEEYLEELNAEGQNIDINNHACKLLYEGTSLALPTIGTEKTIKAIDAKMLQEYFQAHYIPENMTLAAAGCLSHEQFLALAERYFSPLCGSGGQVIPKNYFQGAIAENQTRPAATFQYDLDSQVQLQICFRSVSYNDPDYYAVYLINRIFDDGIASRLQRALREDLGLAYSIECRATSMSDIGTFDFDVTVSREKILQVARIIFREIKTFLAFGPNEEELAHVKKRYLYDLDFDLDEPYKQILRYGFAQLYSDEITIEEEKAIIESIGIQDLQRLAEKIFVREKLNLILVGPFTPELKMDLEKLIDAF